MAHHSDEFIHPVLVNSFLVMMGFSIITQLAYIAFELYCLVELLEQGCCEQEDSETKTAKSLLGPIIVTRHVWHNSKYLLLDSILESVKFYLMLMALMSITDKWKFANLAIFVVIFGMTMVMQWFQEDYVVRLISRDRTLPEDVNIYEQVTFKLLYYKKMAHFTTFFICLLCISNIVYIYWNSMKEYVGKNK